MNRWTEPPRDGRPRASAGPPEPGGNKANGGSHDRRQSDRDAEHQEDAEHDADNGPAGQEGESGQPHVPEPAREPERVEARETDCADEGIVQNQFEVDGGQCLTRITFTFGARPVSSVYGMPSRSEDWS